MTVLDTGRQAADTVADAAGRTLAMARALLGLGADVAGVAVGWMAAGGARVRSILARTASGVERVSGRSVPALPVVGSEGTVLAVALGLAGVATVWFGVGMDTMGAALTDLVGATTLGRAAMLAVAVAVAWVIWTRSRAVGSVRASTRAAVTGLVGLGAGAAVGIQMGVFEPLVLFGQMVGDVIVTGATGGFATIMGLIGAASAKLLGAGRKGIGAAGGVAAISGGFVAAATVPALAGGTLIGISLITNNPVYAAVFGTAIVFTVTGPMVEAGDFIGDLGFAVRILSVVALSVIAASHWLGLDVPFMLIGGVGLG